MDPCCSHHPTAVTVVWAVVAVVFQVQHVERMKYQQLLVIGYLLQFNRVLSNTITTISSNSSSTLAFQCSLPQSRAFQTLRGILIMIYPDHIILKQHLLLLLLYHHHLTNNSNNNSHHYQGQSLPLEMNSTKVQIYNIIQR
jgi:hypothetical protein